MDIDELVVDWIDEIRSPGATTLFEAATHLADYWVATVVVVVTSAVLVARHRRVAAGVLAASSFGAMAVTEVLKVAIGRERPPVDTHLIEAAGFAFPSGHSSQAVACYGGLALVAVLTTRRTVVRAMAVAAAIAIALVVGVSRVYLRVHWPTDVLVGWAVGLAWLALVVLAARLLRSRYRRSSATRKSEPSRNGRRSQVDSSSSTSSPAAATSARNSSNP